MRTIAHKIVLVDEKRVDKIDEISMFVLLHHFDLGEKLNTPPVFAKRTKKKRAPPRLTISFFG